MRFCIKEKLKFRGPLLEATVTAVTSSSYLRMFILPEGRAGEAWEHSKNVMLIPHPGSPYRHHYSLTVHFCSVLPLFWTVFDPRSDHVRFWGEQSGTATGFPPTAVSPVYYHSIIAPYSSSSAWCSYQKGRRAKPDNLQTTNALSQVGERRTETQFQCFSSLKG
jgi:hypothetical protein